VTVICAADPAVASGVDVVNVHAFVPLGVPRPSPTETVDCGLRAVNVTLSVPACVTMKLNILDPCGASVPVNVSAGGEVVEGDVESFIRPQPAAEVTALRYMRRPTTLRTTINERSQLVMLPAAFYRREDCRVLRECRLRICQWN
jgi:hypothetical protein